jgi:hypothetical protein
MLYKGEADECGQLEHFRFDCTKTQPRRGARSVFSVHVHTETEG